jgi:cell division protein ZapA
MSNVALSIGGREYFVACAAGEEQHVGNLGRMIDEKLADIPNGQTMNETRSLLFAALLLADQLYEFQSAPQPAADEATVSAPVMAGPAAIPDLDQLEMLADRLEQLAARIETIKDQ